MARAVMNDSRNPWIIFFKKLFNLITLVTHHRSTFIQPYYLIDRREYLAVRR